MVKKILMVCLGNICRSPIAEAVMIDTIEKAGVSDNWKVDSAGTAGWHTGKTPDRRALQILRNHNVTYDHKARRLKPTDFIEFDYIFGMDYENMNDLKDMAPNPCKARLIMLGAFLDPLDKIIEDPYYESGDDGFEKVYQQCVVACDRFLTKALANEI